MIWFALPLRAYGTSRLLVCLRILYPDEMDTIVCVQMTNVTPLRRQVHEGRKWKASYSIQIERPNVNGVVDRPGFILHHTDRCLSYRSFAFGSTLIVVLGWRITENTTVSYPRVVKIIISHYQLQKEIFLPFLIESSRTPNGNGGTNTITIQHVIWLWNWTSRDSKAKDQSKTNGHLFFLGFGFVGFGLSIWWTFFYQNSQLQKPRRGW